MAKIALVTGSSKGIGKAIALTLSKGGFDVIIHCQNSKQQAEETIQKIKDKKRKAFLVYGDVSKENEVKKMFKNISKFTQKLDLVVNNAGFDYGYLIEDFTLSQIKEVIDTNLIGKIAVTKYALPFLKKSKNPSIVNISSRMGGPTTIETIGAYGPASAGIIKFTQCCALEFKKYKIRVNTIAPGLTDTELNRKIYPDNNWWNLKAKNNPRGRYAQPQDIANVVSFVASEKADYINGETILVTGGSELG